MADAWRDERTATLKSLLSSGDYSDLVITCGGDTYKVHKSIVCSQSGFFKKAESFGGKETSEGKIDLPEDDPKIVKLLIQYLYEGEYDPRLPEKPYMDLTTGFLSIKVPKEHDHHYEFPHTCLPKCPKRYRVCPHHECNGNTCGKNCRKFVCPLCTGPQLPTGGPAQLLLHSRLYSISDKYDITSLKTLSQEKFALACGAYWADDALISAAEHVLTSTLDQDQGLRKILGDVLADHLELIKKRGIEALMRKYADFTFGVLQRLAEKVK